jgi:leucyl aminopeptidase
MFKCPEIPKRVSSLLSTQVKNQLSDIKKRKVSAMSTRSNSSTISEFLDAKVREFELDIEYTSHYRTVLRKAYEKKKISEKNWNRMRKTISKKEKKHKKEYVTLKRQRKLIEEDMEDANIHQTTQRAYAISMVNRVKISPQISSKERTAKKHIQEGFRRDVINYYAAEKITEGHKLCYCVVSGRWYVPGEVKAAHIVPKSLESDELSYLFGAGEMNLSDARNGSFFLFFTYSRKRVIN